jgi:hypothetical protein
MDNFVIEVSEAENIIRAEAMRYFRMQASGIELYDSEAAANVGKALGAIEFAEDIICALRAKVNDNG